VAKGRLPNLGHEGGPPGLPEGGDRLGRTVRGETINTVALRRQVADAAIEQVGYPLA